MTDRSRSFTSSSDFDLPRHRSHSYREKSTRIGDDLHRQKIERIQRRFERDLDRSTRESEWTKKQRSDAFLSPREYVENIRTKLQNGYNQLMQQKVEEIEEYLNQRYDEEYRLAQRKFRKAQIANEKFRLRSINEILHQRDTICEEKLAAQRSLYTRLLDEQARRLHAEKYVQSYENLNVDQLKDRLTRVEHSNNELQQLIRYLIDRQPSYKNAIYIPKFPPYH